MTSRTFLRFAALASIVVPVAAVACSGSSDSSISSSDPGSMAPPLGTGTGSGTDASASTGTGDDGSTASSGGDDSSMPAQGDDSGNGSGNGDAGGNGNGSGDAGDAAVADAGHDPAPTTCPANGATTETESNDTLGTANTFTSVACGTIDPLADVDYWKFTLSASAHTIHVASNGSVTLEITSMGDTATIPGSSPIPFHPGAEYDVKVTGSATGAYTILVQF